MKLHVMDQLDNEIIAEIDLTLYQHLLQTKSGRELATAVKEAYVIVDNDPTRSAIDNTTAFFPYQDVVNGVISSEELLEELINY